MNRTVRLAGYVLLLTAGLWITPPRLYNESLVIAGIGLACVVLVQARATRNVIDEALAWCAIWAALSVLCAPFIPIVHGLGEIARGAL